MADDEERVLEGQLELQLQDQRDSLASLEEARASDPSNPELLLVYKELVQAIKDAEESLLQLTRARLLREADSALQCPEHLGEDVTVEPLDPAQVQAEPLESPSYSVGSKCRFRYTDGRWYNGLIVDLEGSDSAKDPFLTPTSENMLMCKFFMQQRCRFGSNCRLSHVGACDGGRGVQRRGRSAVGRQPRPVACSSCNSNGLVECKWCGGTGFFILGDKMLCQVPSRKTSCVICDGKGSTCCTDC